MTEDTQPGADREVPSDKPTRARKGQVGKDSAEAKRLKTALFAALKRTDLNLKEIAELCGLENANAFCLASPVIPIFRLSSIIATEA